MRFFVYVLLLLVLAIADKHAVIMATADGWFNYSITSNPCRAYDDFVKMGVPPENIIFMMYSSNLNYSKNPYPGKIFTDAADNTDGDWAQYGCFEHIDYTADKITKSTFLSILSGDISKVSAELNIENPKVLKSGPDDNLFFYVMDHGDYGYFYVNDQGIDRWAWKYAVNKLYKNQKYKYCVVFMEACYGGSMWSTLPDNQNMVVISSADDAHPADMSNCPPNDYIGDKHLDTCLSGLFDNSYLKYIEEHPDATIYEVYEAVAKDVRQISDQGVSMWGDDDVADMKISDFLGSNLVSKKCTNEPKEQSVVPVPEVPLHLAKWAVIRAEKENEEELLKQYQDLVYTRAKEEIELMRLAVSIKGEQEANLLSSKQTTMFDGSCVEGLVYELVHQCGHTTSFTSKAMNILRGICEGKTNPNVNWENICLYDCWF